MTRGYFTREGIAVLEIGEALPRNKFGMLPEVHERWLELLHRGIADLAGQQPIPRFQKAMVGVRITTAANDRKKQLWDVSNRALNLVFNQLKGIFIPDDNYRHLGFAVTGDTGKEERTVIYIGDFHTQSVQIMELLTVQNANR